MLRKFFAVLAFAVTGLLTFVAMAAAANPPYPAPRVRPDNPPYPAPSVVPDGAAHTASTLASTGTGFNVGAAVLIAVVVLLLGAAIVMLTRRLRQSNSH